MLDVREMGIESKVFIDDRDYPWRNYEYRDEERTL